MLSVEAPCLRPGLPHEHADCCYEPHIAKTPVTSSRTQCSWWSPICLFCCTRLLGSWIFGTCWWYERVHDGDPLFPSRGSRHSLRLSGDYTAVVIRTERFR